MRNVTMLKKIASAYLNKQAAQDFSWFDPRVWDNLFNGKRTRAQMKWAQSPIRADIITDKNGNKIKDYSREQERAKYYGDRNKVTTYAGNGQYYKQNQIGRSFGTSADPAQFERDLNKRYIDRLNWQSKTYKDIRGVQMAQGPDMTKNLPRTGANRAYVEAKANVDKRVSSAVGSMYRGFDNASTGLLRLGEATNIPGLVRFFSNGQYGETGERFTPWNKLTGKSNTWFQKVQAPKSGVIGRAINPVSNWIVNNADGYGAVNVGLTALGVGAAGNGIKATLLAPKAATAATKAASTIGLGQMGYDMAKGLIPSAANQTPQQVQPNNNPYISFNPNN